MKEKDSAGGRGGGSVNNGASESLFSRGEKSAKATYVRARDQRKKKKEKRWKGRPDGNFRGVPVISRGSQESTRRGGLQKLERNEQIIETRKDLSNERGYSPFQGALERKRGEVLQTGGGWSHE